VGTLIFRSAGLRAARAYAFIPLVQANGHVGICVTRSDSETPFHRNAEALERECSLSQYTSARSVA
jgi:hypothetical protein